MPMLRFVLSTMAVAGILATMLAAFADPATAADHAQAAVAVTAPPAPPAPARLSPSVAPAADGHDTIPVGFGWG
jgi:hypothetical protein